MRDLLWSRMTLIWLALVVATVTSWLLGHGVGLHGTRWAGSAILVVTFVKVRFVVREFMEIRQAPVVMQRIFDAWILGCCAVLIGLFLRGSA